ncbi:MAG: HIT family protein [Clostridium sp.]|nr:HIT family protein [Clostridium sp.]MCM1173076.1 HIT family protein [Clostridium sp.]MCM1209875.1 HIT family protein [Ruminococcus sp.]
MKKDDCIFCKIAAGEIPSTTVYETNKFKVFFDIAPASKGHALIIPKEHFDNIFSLDSETAGKLFSLATVVAGALKEETGCDGMNLLQNNGEVAGQTVHHFHMHLIPRYEGDDIKLVPASHEADKDYLADLAERVKKHI